MPKEPTAREKLAARTGASTVPPPPKPPKEPGVAPAPRAPTTTLYRVFVLLNIDPGKGGEDEVSETLAWLPLPGDEATPGETAAVSYAAALDVALEQARARRAALATEGDEQAVAIKLTVAAIGSRNWNQGTALVELRPVTTWEK